MQALKIRNVAKSFGTTHILKDINIEIDAGEFLILVGPSGCGKSTLLNCLAGLEDVSSGEIWMGGRLVNTVSPKDRDIAMVFQSYALYPHMTVAENMGFALRMAGVPRAARDEQVGRAAEVLRIGDLLGRLPKQLSGGQRQRVAIGRAIVRKPKVFLFDEPLSNLDAALRVNMRIELSRLHRELGTTMIYVTHDQVEAMTLGERIAVFDQGRIEQLGAPLDLYNVPANEFVAGFLGAPRINLIDRPCAAASAAHRALWDRLTPSAGAEVHRVGLRAEHLQVLAPGAGIPATLELAEHLGDTSILHLRVEGLTELLHAKAGPGHDALSAGQAVALLPDAAWALRFGAAGQRVA